MVMVNVVNVKNRSFNTSDSIVKNCIAEKTCGLSLNWTVQSTLYFNTAFFFGELFTQIPGGLLATMFSPNSQYALVMVIRVLQGLVEGPAYSSINGVISAWSLKSEKSRMVTLTYAGSSLSSAVAFIVSGALSCRVCWNAPLYFYGCLGIVWSTLFMCTVKDSPSNNKHLSTAERLLFDSERCYTKKPSSQTVKSIPWKNILTSVPVSAIFVACFTRNWMISLVRTVVPQYMEDLFDLSIFEIGLLSSLSAICMALVTVTGGVMIDKLIKSDCVSTTVGRKIAQCSGYGIEGICIFCLGYIQDIDAAMVMLCVGVGASGLAVSVFKDTYHPPIIVSIVTGITRMGITGATISTLLVSLLRSRTQVSLITTWREVFMVAGCLHIAGVIYYGIFASGERQPWGDGVPESNILDVINQPSDTDYKKFKNDSENDNFVHKLASYEST
ncbi:vesicular glutamate transporter 2.1-like [Mytilus californianus]|uniref:vesicular glutamate transporter 2.1-like n=1 Tax=Mytilus californianus TaxID=6549 RepID=UPI0022452EB3|nr:vesicular glutamate transporter 2.1-like [Mytilus californianus]